MSLGSGIQTGLLSWSLKREQLGDGIYFRDLQTYDYEIYGISNPSPSGFSQIENDLLKVFSSTKSGDITVKGLGFPADYQFPNDHVRAAKFNFQVEVRSVPSNLSGSQNEITGLYYKGLDQSFFSNYGNLLDSFSENFSFANEENGNKTFGHDFSFVLRSGGRTGAAALASGLFGNDKDTTFGISAFIGGISGGDTGNFQNYYNESYDLLKNSFSFSKKREFLPFDAAPYLYNLIHSLNVLENGIIEVDEKGDIQGKLTFANAQAGYDSLKSSSYARCSGVYESYRNVGAGVSVTGSLANLAIASNRTLVKPSLSISYDIKYTDDPNLDSSNLISVEKILDVDYSDQKFVNINHTYNFTALINPTYPNMDNDFVNNISQASTYSPIIVQDYYQNSPFYRTDWPLEHAVKFASTLPNRRKNFSASFSYTNNPIYFFGLDGYTYNSFEPKITDVIPPDVISEYKIINRPTKTSLINYAYQTERGTKTISITARLQRPPNVFNAPVSDLSEKLLSIYRFGVSKLMETFFGLNTLALTYHLSDIKYTFDSENQLTMGISITYTIKKYTA